MMVCPLFIWTNAYITLSHHLQLCLEPQISFKLVSLCRSPSMVTLSSRISNLCAKSYSIYNICLQCTFDGLAAVATMNNLWEAYMALYSSLGLLFILLEKEYMEIKYIYFQ